MRAQEFESQTATGQDILRYVKSIHDDFHLDHEILKHKTWRLQPIPLTALHIPDPESGIDPQDPYDRVQYIDMYHVDDISARDIERRPIVVDHDGHILDGNHRAVAARLQGMKTIPAWRPHTGAPTTMRAQDFVTEAKHFLRPGELRGSYTDQDMTRMGFRRAVNGAWYIDQRRWEQLIRSGVLREGDVIRTKFATRQAQFESVSRTLYHYTGLWSAVRILETGQFQLSSTLGTDVEQSYAPPGYPYFLSATRTVTGGYHDYVGSSAVMFVLAGTWFNARYPGRAVDYWGNRDPLKMHHRRHEAEDRIFSREPAIPLGGVRAVHVLVKPDAEDTHRAWARRLLISAKRQAIPAYLYSDEQAWRRLDTRHTVSVSSLTGADDSGRSWSRGHRGYLMPWMELMFGRDRAQLSKRADRLRYNLEYSYNTQDALRGLAADLSNARKPNSGPDREHVAKIIALMRRERLDSLTDLVNWVRDRWSKPAVDENFADGKKPGRKGLSKRVGIPRKASLSQLAKIAKTSSGERRRMAQWQLNMRRGRAKKHK